MLQWFEVLPRQASLRSVRHCMAKGNVAEHECDHPHTGTGNLLSSSLLGLAPVYSGSGWGGKINKCFTHSITVIRPPDMCIVFFWMFPWINGGFFGQCLHIVLSRVCSFRCTECLECVRSGVGENSGLNFPLHPNTFNVAGWRWRGGKWVGIWAPGNLRNYVWPGKDDLGQRFKETKWKSLVSFHGGFARTLELKQKRGVPRPAPLLAQPCSGLYGCRSPLLPWAVAPQGCRSQSRLISSPAPSGIWGLLS